MIFSLFFLLLSKYFFTFIQIFLLRPAGVLLLLLIHRFRHVTQDKRLFDQLLMRPNLSRCSDVQWLSGDHQTPALSLSLSLCLLLSLSLSLSYNYTYDKSCKCMQWHSLERTPGATRSQINTLPAFEFTHSLTHSHLCTCTCNTDSLLHFLSHLHLPLRRIFYSIFFHSSCISTDMTTIILFSTEWVPVSKHECVCVCKLLFVFVCMCVCTSLKLYVCLRCRWADVCDKNEQSENGQLSGVK